MNRGLTLVEVLVVVGILTVVVIVAYFVKHPCIKSHKEMVHHDAWTQMVYTGKIFVPIYHSAEDRLEEICDERK